MLLSDCCTAPPAGGMEEYGICGECKEHCEFWDDEEEEPVRPASFFTLWQLKLKRLKEEDK